MMAWRQKAYEELPALSVRGGELRRSLRLVTAAWGFGIVWMTVCLQSSATNYMGRLVGFSDSHFGWLGALPFMATSIQLLATVVIERTGLRKHQFITFGVIHRAIWALVALVPLVAPIPSRVAVWTMLFLILCSWAAEAMARPAWMSWMGDLIPKRIRGRYLARRTVVTRLIQLPIVVLLAVYLSRVVDSNVPISSQPHLKWALGATFLIAAAFGIADILLFQRIKEVCPSTRDRLREPAVRVHMPPGRRGAPFVAARFLGAMVKEFIAEPLQQRIFRRFVLYGATMAFAMAVSAQFCRRQLLEAVAMGPIGVDLLFIGLGPVIGMVAAPFWGKLVDGWGRRPVLFLATLLTCFSMLPYFFAMADTPNPGWVAAPLASVVGSVGSLFGQGEWAAAVHGAPIGAWLVMSISIMLGASGWGGVALAQLTVVFGFSDGQGRSKYVAASGLLISIGGLLGGLTGGYVAEALRQFNHTSNPLQVGPFLWNNWHAVFVLSIVTRALGLFWLRDMPDPGSGRVRDMMRMVSMNVVNGMAAWLFYPLRIFGWKGTLRRRPVVGRAEAEALSRDRRRRGVARPRDEDHNDRDRAAA